MHFRSLAAVILLAAWPLAVGCTKSDAVPTAKSTVPEPQATTSGAPPPLLAAPVPDCTADFPGLPLSEIPPSSRTEFCKFASDNLCFCGCPHTLSGCLKEHPTCRHAARMSVLALAEIVGAQGTADSAAKVVAGYYDSFKAENRVSLPVDQFPCQGPADAKLTMVEFSDFDCPHCKAARPMFEKMVQSRHDLRLCFASFPLHKHSGLAATAAAFAQKKGAFWRLHDLMFEEQDARANADEMAYVDQLVKLGARAGLDPDELRTALANSAEVDKLTESQRELAHRLQLEGTPSIFINGRIVPPLSPELYQLSLDDEAEWLANDHHWGKD